MNSSKPIVATIVLFICIVFTTIACSTNSSINSSINSSTNSNSTPLSLSDAPDDVQAIYKSRCISCHGVDLAGRMGEQTNLQQVYTYMSYEQISEQITNGGEIMFGFEGKLTADEIAALSQWLSQQE